LIFDERNLGLLITAYGFQRGRRLLLRRPLAERPVGLIEKLLATDTQHRRKLGHAKQRVG
jgi:hypothetical protein